MPTTGISLQKEVTSKAKPPRTLFLRYPFGHPLGQTFHVQQQWTIVLQALKALETIGERGTILESGYTWRRHRFKEG
jgi:hypothetical protein